MRPGYEAKLPAHIYIVDVLCNHYKTLRCEDYIQINRGIFGTTEICGNNTPSSSVSQLESSSANIIFRTSEEVHGVGFEMQVICFRETDRDLPGISNSIRL